LKFIVASLKKIAAPIRKLHHSNYGRCAEAVAIPKTKAAPFPAPPF
jgi:hypothetical protein